ncbi:MAG TPA: hypothetical protein VEB22_06515 [Phycisphaerales bacterium]|nr:hypothetical protein [Phycisphaerales bacterium]
MNTRLLSSAEFKATLAAPKRDVLATAANVIDIWPYVAAVPIAELSGHTVAVGLVEHVYRNSQNTFDHVLVVTNTKNVYLVVVVDLTADTIRGHYLQDLNREYGLPTLPTPSTLRSFLRRLLG